MDERVVGVPTGGGAGMTPGSPAKEEDFSSVALSALLVHGNWKARRDGYERVTSDPAGGKAEVFRSIKKIVSEGNAAAQDALFEMLVALVPVCSAEERVLLAGAPLQLALEKGITGRPRAAKASSELAAQLVEAGHPAEVMAPVLEAFKHRTPKNRMAAAQLCAALVADFGTEHFPVREVLKAMQPLFNDANPQVRKEAISLCCQCYRCVGAAIKQYLTELRDVQLQELETQFETVTVGARPPRSIRGMASAGGGAAAGAAAPLPAGGGGLRGDDTSGDADDAVFETLEESPVVPKLPKKFFSIALSKEAPWQERCQYVTETLLPLLSAPRFRARDDYHELAALIKAYLTDSQAPPMLLGFKMVQECARGLRGSFAGLAKQYLSFLFEKMVDKKASVLLHVRRTLEALIKYHCITLDQCHEDIEHAAQSKSPNQRLAVIQFCTAMVDTLEAAQCQRLARATGMLKRMVNDEKPENREATYALLAKLVQANGRDAYKSVFASMDDKQLAKYQAVEETVGAGGDTSASAAAPAVEGETPSRSPQKKVPRTEIGSARGSVVSAQPRSGGKASGPAAAGALPEHPGSGKPRSAANSGRAAQNVMDPFALEAALPQKYDCTNIMLGYLEGDDAVYNLLRSADWAKRLDGMQKLKAATEGWKPGQLSQRVNALVTFVRSNPTFKESTVQVFHLLLAVLADVVARCAELPAAAAYVVVSGCTPRLPEPKNKPTILSIFDTIAGRLGERFVVRHMMLVATQLRTPKLVQECNEYFLDLAEKQKESENEESELDIKGMVEYIRKPCLEISVQQVRAVTFDLLFALRELNAGLVDECMAPGTAKAAAQQYEQECAKRGIALRAAGDDAACDDAGSHARDRARLPAGHRHSARPDVKSAGYAAAAASAAGSLHGGQPQQLPRGNARTTPRGSLATNASAEVPPSLKPVIRQINQGADWRERLDGVHQVSEYISTQIVPAAAVTPLLTALGGRLKEPNKNFVLDVLTLLADVVRVTNPEDLRAPLRKQLPAVMDYLGDQKPNLRDAARAVLMLAVETAGLADLLALFQKPLKSDSNMCRLNALEIMAHGFEIAPEDTPMPRAGLQLYVPAVCLSVMDRMQEVRAAAETVLGYMIAVIGDEPFMSHLSTLKPADQQSIMPAIERQCQRLESGEQLQPQQVIQEEKLNSTTRSSLERSAKRQLRTPSPPRAYPPMPTVTQTSSSGSAHAAATAAEENEEAKPFVVPTPTEERWETQQQQQQRSPPDMTYARPEDNAYENEEVDAGEEVHTLPEILVGLKSASPHVAYVMCTDFMRLLRSSEDCATAEMVQVMTERLADNVRRFYLDLSLALIGCLGAIVVTPIFAQRCYSTLLFRMLGSLFDCLLSDTFSQHEDVVKSLNNLILKVLQNCTPDHVFSALISLLAGYSSTYIQSGRKSDLKCIQVTVKCVLRVRLEEVAEDNVIVCCHEYLLQYPPSSFRSLDDIAIRSIKTILQKATRLHGAGFLHKAEVRVGPKNVVVHFIRMCLEAEAETETPTRKLPSQPQAPRSKHENEEVANEEFEQEVRASVSPPPKPRQQHQDPVLSSAATPLKIASSPAPAPAAGKPAAKATTAESPFAHKPTTGGGLPARNIATAAPAAPSATVAAPVAKPSPAPASSLPPPASGLTPLPTVFAHIRNHETTAEGIEELYRFLCSDRQAGASQEFLHQFNRCSEPFRMFLKRKLEKKMEEDPSCPEGFTLPQVIANL